MLVVHLLKKMADDKTQIRVHNSPAFKLKDKERRNHVLINFQKDFGFIPEQIIIEKVKGYNNAFIVRAILTPEEIKKEDERIKNLKATQPHGNTSSNKKKGLRKTTSV